jgi:hypothetical protein
MPKYQRQRVDVDAERRLLTGMVADTRFLSGIVPVLRDEFLRVPFVKTVAQWCIEYHGRYGEAPGATIQDLYDARVRAGQLDEAQAELVGRFLRDISARWEADSQAFNAAYELDQAERLLRERALEAVGADISSFLARGEVEQAEAVVAGFRRPARPETRGLDPLDPAVAMAAFMREGEDVLFQMPGELGRMMGPFSRGQLWAVLAPQKRGKTWWLLETSVRAILSGLSVLFVSLELTEMAVVRRLYHNICGLPTARWAGPVPVPVFDCMANQLDECGKDGRTSQVGLMAEGGRPTLEDAPLDYRPCTACRGTREWRAATWFRVEDLPALEGDRAARKAQALVSQFVRGGRLRVMQLPAGRVDMETFRATLDNLEHYEGFTPDVIVTDYADKFDRGQGDYRHGVAAIWEAHKALAQERHVMVLTASQANTARTGKDAGAGSWAEDIRKLAEIDGAWALNQTPRERADGIMRVPVVAIREDDSDAMGQAIVLEQKRIGRPYLDSFWGSLDRGPEEKEEK